MPARNYGVGKTYRYSINGQEKEKEINENITSAEFWQYDARIVRRWNTDPKLKIWESPYMAFSGNPVVFSDYLGDTTLLYTSNGTYMGINKMGNGLNIFISKKENDEKLQEWHDSNFKELNSKARTEAQFLAILKDLGSSYNVTSIRKFHTVNNGKGEIKTIGGVKLEDMYNIKINGKSATIKQVMALLKKEGIGPEKKANFIEDKNGIFSINQASVVDDGDPIEVGTGSKIAHIHPNSSKVLVITFNSLIRGMKIPNQPLQRAEFRPYGGMDDWDMNEAKKFGLTDNVRNAVVEKNYIFLYNSDKVLRIKY